MPRGSGRAAIRARSPRRPARACALFAIGLGITAIGLPDFASANDNAPTAEQLTERERGLGAIWDSLLQRSAGLRIRLEERVVSTGEFQGAELAWFRTGLAIEGGVPLGEKWSLAISPSFAWERLAIVGKDDFIVSQAGRDARFTDFYDSSLRLGARYAVNERWSAEFVSGFSARHESGADYGDAAQSGGSAAISYRRGKWLRIRLGVGLGADLDDGDLRVTPVYRIQVKPNPEWTLESSGLGAKVEWDATARTTLSLSGQREGTQYRLDRRGTPPAGSGDATLQRRQVRLDFELLHRLHKKLRLRGGIGVVLDEQLTVIDEDDIEVDDRNNKDPSVTLRLGVEWRL